MQDVKEERFEEFRVALSAEVEALNAKGHVSWDCERKPNCPPRIHFASA